VMSMRNTQHSTICCCCCCCCCRSWHMGYDDGLKGASGNKMARDQDDDRK
jgi:hypothetical protein